MLYCILIFNFLIIFQVAFGEQRFLGKFYFDDSVGLGIFRSSLRNKAKPEIKFIEAKIG